MNNLPYDSDYAVRIAQLKALGGDTTKTYNSIYDIDLAILDAIQHGGGGDTYSRAQIDAMVNELYEEINSAYYDLLNRINTAEGDANVDIETSTIYDFTFVSELPATGEQGQMVVISADTDTLYEFNEQWNTKQFESNAFYFDTDNEILYNYKSDVQKLAEVSRTNTIVVGSNLNDNAALKQITSVGTYNVLQHTVSSGKPLIKNWILTVSLADFEEEDRDVIYQELSCNQTIRKRAYKQTTDIWGTFLTYYKGLVRDTTTSKYYTWSSQLIDGYLENKINRVDYINDDSKLFYILAANNVTIAKNANFSAASQVYIEYSYNGLSWQELTTEPINLKIYQRLYLRGIIGEITNAALGDSNGWFTTTGLFDAYGDIRYLYNYKNPYESIRAFGFLNAFKNTGLRKAPMFTGGFCGNNAFRDTFRTDYLEESMRIEGAVWGGDKITDETNPYYDKYVGSIFASTYRNCVSLTKTHPIVITGFGTISYLYAGCTSLKEVAPIYIYKLANVQNTFNGCTNLEKCSIISTETSRYSSTENIGNFTNVPNACQVTLSEAIDYSNLNIGSQVLLSSPNIEFPVYDYACKLSDE